MERKKTYTIFAGVNGAGKSTIYETLLNNSEERRVNSDEILVSAGGQWNNTTDQFNAMKEAVKRIDHYVNHGISFNQETTLAGKSIATTMRRAKENGYYIRMYYIGLESADLAVKRVKRRMEKGGHGIDEDVIRKRYVSSLNMLNKVYKLCDFLAVYDNSKTLHQIAEYSDKRWIIHDTDYEWFKVMQEIQLSHVNSKISKQLSEAQKIGEEIKRIGLCEYYGLKEYEDHIELTLHSIRKNTEIVYINMSDGYVWAEVDEKKLDQFACSVSYPELGRIIVQVETMYGNWKGDIMENNVLTEKKEIDNHEDR